MGCFRQERHYIQYLPKSTLKKNLAPGKDSSLGPGRLSLRRYTGYCTELPLLYSGRESGCGVTQTCSWEASEKLKCPLGQSQQAEKGSQTKDVSSNSQRVLWAPYTRVREGGLFLFFFLFFKMQILGSYPGSTESVCSSYWTWKCGLPIQVIRCILNTDNHCFGSLGFHIRHQRKSCILKAIFNSISSIQVWELGF